nr:MAG TPA: DNA methyltransferase [Caudoviricetes sp.]
MKDPSKIKVLVACEESQRVCMAFRERGFEAYSCDIQDPSGGHPEWHIIGDALKAIGAEKITVINGTTHYIGKWDLLIAHPPCTYLSKVATRHYSLRCTPAEKVCARLQERTKAAVFFMRFALAEIPHIAVENPVGIMSTAYRKPDQIIHPWQFSGGENDKEQYVTKATCLWLKGLPPLQPTYNGQAPDNANMYGISRNGKNRTWESMIGKNRQKNRSKTFPGIAKAMAEQWGYYFMKEDQSEVEK